jgi:hypothetical protein
MVEIFFGIITRQAIRRGSFTSIKDLIDTIRRFIDSYNERCQPFAWTKDADTILAKAHDHPRLKMPSLRAYATLADYTVRLARLALLFSIKRFVHVCLREVFCNRVIREDSSGRICFVVRYWWRGRLRLPGVDGYDA